MVHELYRKRFCIAAAIVSFYGITVTTTTIVTAATPSINARSLSPQVTFGDSLSIECTVILPPGYRIDGPTPEAPANLAPSWHSSEPDVNVGIIREQFGFRFYAFEPDTLIAGPFQFTIADSSGVRSTLTSNEVAVLVKTVLAAEDTIPQPNRSPMTIKGQGIPGWLITLAIVLLIALAALIIYLRKRKKTNELLVIDESIDEIGEFLKIKELDLHEKGRLKDLYVLISAALRGFIHRNMGFAALFETTDEITRELTKSDYSHDINKLFSSMLYESDMVLFARFVPSREQSSTIIDRALVPVKAVLDENARRAVSVQPTESSSDMNSDPVVPSKTVAVPVREEGKR
jgi:hypothetical protein